LEQGVVRARVRVAGLVQGVGFRPLVWRTATGLGLSGWVANDPAGVVLEIEGQGADVTALLTALTSPPPLARVDEVESTLVATTGDRGFEVRISDLSGARGSQVSPDTATCADCLRELHDPGDRRFGYSFLNCTNCGPGYTIVLSVPYDRSRTTMASFPMCAACDKEYEDPGNRRFHAEPVCCPACGPALEILGASGDPLLGAVACRLARGARGVPHRDRGRRASRRARRQNGHRWHPDRGPAAGGAAPADLLMPGQAGPIQILGLRPASVSCPVPFPSLNKRRPLRSAARGAQPRHRIGEAVSSQP
jgi:acylphosphatase